MGEELKRAAGKQLAGCFEVGLGNQDLAPETGRHRTGPRASSLTISALDASGSQQRADDVGFALACDGGEMYAYLHGLQACFVARKHSVT